MIIYGAKSKVLKTQRVPARCSSCGQEGQGLVGVQRYAHIYWIPLFPLPKQVMAACEHCQKVTNEKDFDANVKMHSGQFRQSLRTPFYLYIGLILIGSGVAFGAYESHKDSIVTAEHTAHPVAGDVFVLYDSKSEDKDYRYAYARVVGVSDQALTLEMSRYRFSLSSGIKDKDVAATENYYTEEPVRLERPGLDGMEIRKVYPGVFRVKDTGDAPTGTGTETDSGTEM